MKRRNSEWDCGLFPIYFLRAKSVNDGDEVKKTGSNPLLNYGKTNQHPVKRHGRKYYLLPVEGYSLYKDGACTGKTNNKHEKGSVELWLSGENVCGGTGLVQGNITKITALPAFNL